MLCLVLGINGPQAGAEASDRKASHAARWVPCISSRNVLWDVSPTAQSQALPGAARRRSVGPCPESGCDILPPKPAYCMTSGKASALPRPQFLTSKVRALVLVRDSRTILTAELHRLPGSRWTLPIRTYGGEAWGQ